MPITSAIKQRRVISKRSKYNYLSKLKKIGRDKKSMQINGIDITVCEDFKEYYLSIEKISIFTDELNINHFNRFENP